MHQGSALPQIMQSRRPLSPLQPISIVPQSGSLSHARQRLRAMLHSFNHRARVHPSPFNHSPTSHFSPTGNISSSPDGPVEEPIISSVQPVQQVTPSIHGYHVSTLLWPRKKKKGP